MAAGAALDLESFQPVRTEQHYFTVDTNGRPVLVLAPPSEDLSNPNAKSPVYEAKFLANLAHERRHFARWKSSRNEIAKEWPDQQAAHMAMEKLRHNTLVEETLTVQDELQVLGERGQMPAPADKLTLENYPEGAEFARLANQGENRETLGDLALTMLERALTTMREHEGDPMIQLILARGADHDFIPFIHFLLPTSISTNPDANNPTELESIFGSVFREKIPRALEKIKFKPSDAPTFVTTIRAWKKLTGARYLETSPR